MQRLAAPGCPQYARSRRDKRRRRRLPSHPMTAAPTAGDALALVRLAAAEPRARARAARRASTTSTSSRCPTATPARTSRRPRGRCRRSAGDSDRAVRDRTGRRARRPAGRARQLRDHPLAARAGRLRPSSARAPALDGPAVAEALAASDVEAAYARGREPVEGTILTVARALARGAEAARDGDPIATLAAGLAAAETRSRARPTCCRAARGRCRRRRRRRSRRARPRAARGAARRAGRRRAALGARHAVAPMPCTRTPPAPRYCTGFLVAAQAVAARAAREPARAARRLRLVVAAGAGVQAHVHTDDPGGALSAARAAGVIGASRSATCTRRLRSASRRLAPERACDVVFVIARRRQPRARRASARARPARGPPGTTRRPRSCSRRSTVRARRSCSCSRTTRARCSSPSTRRAGGSTRSRGAQPRARAGPRALVAYRTDIEATARGDGAALAASAAARCSRPCAPRRSTASTTRGRLPRARGRAGDRGVRRARRPRCAPRPIAARAGRRRAHGAGRRGRARGRSARCAGGCARVGHPGVELELHEGGQAHPRYSRMSAEGRASDAGVISANARRSCSTRPPTSPTAPSATPTCAWCR